MFPAKLFEYIAAGKPIISTLDFELGSMMPPTLRVCRTTDEMVEAIQKIVAGHWVVSSAERNDCWRLAESNTWNERAKTFLDIVNTASHRFKC